MEFNHFLSSYLRDPAYTGTRLYKDMVEQAVQAENCGYAGVSIPEHHLINILLVPSPLQMAVKIASATKRIELVTSIAVLPIRDMRVFAGEVVQASMLCDNRLVLGVGRGAFDYEVTRLGTPLSETKKKFEESLAVLEALLTREEVSWDGEYYRFDPITVMPRPDHPIELMLAVMVPEGIYHSAKKGYHVQTTPLGASHEVLLEQTSAFHRGIADGAGANRTNRLALQRGLYLARDTADARAKLELANDYYSRFDNVFYGPGIVDHGAIRPLPRNQTIEELGKSLIICEAAEMVDRLSAYAEAGIDEVIATSNFGQSQADTLDMMERFSAQVMPHFNNAREKSVA
ncbi:LLM class flavin-dependent oxidoreductase [Rhizobium sp. KVB221]|uniref:LLM class flavin-dependent oxidoreductase n=1 Tax=Rhizobium setariae TaxID=2801340 RepID=A0A936YUP6_9HYPH|nr:LLM class flavin-dependent oxidoreductase [Rhizobium setariae]MBL0373347.1 LLM class flavin-dependent oxidoreductase [Rhizobium setariae]